jgi:hypothetical protein
MNKSPYSNYKTDASMEKEGVWVDMGDFQIRLSRAGGSNQQFIKLLEKASRPYRRQLANNTLSNEVANSLLIDAYVSGIIKGWRTKEDNGTWKNVVFDEQGKEIPFSKENAKKLLSDLPDLFTDIQQQANYIYHFQKQEVEEIVKN